MSKFFISANVRGIKEDRPRYEAEQVGLAGTMIRSTTVDLQRRFSFNPFVITSAVNLAEMLLRRKVKSNKSFFKGGFLI